MSNALSRAKTKKQIKSEKLSKKKNKKSVNSRLLARPISWGHLNAQLVIESIDISIKFSSQSRLVWWAEQTFISFKYLFVPMQAAGQVEY